MSTLLSPTKQLLVVIASSALVLSGCSSNGNGSSASSAVVTETETAAPVTSTSQSTTNAPQPSPTTSQPTTSAASSSPSAQPLAPLGTPTRDAKMRTAEGEFDLSIRDIRVAEHSTFTRVVVELAGTGTPGWWVDWTEEPLQQASGLPVDVSGDSFLDLNIEGIGYPDQTAEPGIDFGDFSGAGLVEEANLTSIFEARAQILVGVSGPPRDYSVTLLENPTRVVVDLVD
ncbi:hypothetical protein CDES_08840 [Corynebacterium deserti GIMN1.010]|uniref:AMIN-like domain-containing protein n=1 Tax=Corynebacterium deserti GIMN1.010 TaxID=931089 RepID=A0A0M4CMC3_9CORY|nr:hypothetical protein [Corynebacterium deserti]ALC06160.1 hypothetical protein CDES_08840 [Corynebacterium deserti GIMN1.010]